MKPKDLGKRGEYLARLYLEEKGYLFIRANFAAKGGEIDLVMQENDEIIFVEVKTRTFSSASRYGRGALRIDAEKRQNIRRAAAVFLREETNLCKDLTPRFDAVELYLEDPDSKRVAVLHTPCAF